MEYFRATVLESPYHTLIVAAIFATLYAVVGAVYLVVYRLFLSPVAHIPGPKLAALTFWYEFYYDVWKEGQYTFHLKTLHDQYGPVVRINPYEVHIADPEFYDQLYVTGATRPTDKWWWSANMFSIPTSTISTVSHGLHRQRRSMFANHFSSASVHKLQALIVSHIDKLVERLEEVARTGQPVSLTYAYSALTMDIITTYAFNESTKCLENPEFSKQHHEMFVRVSMQAALTKQLPWLVPMLQVLPTPQWLTRLIFPDLADLLQMQQGWREQVTRLQERKGEATRSGQAFMHSDTPENSLEGNLPRTIFETMLDAKVDASEKSVDRLMFDAQLIVIAGTITTAHTLMTITYHLLDNPEMLARLKEELAAAIEEQMQTGTLTTEKHSQIPLKTLEKLPYINAVIREGLRMAYGVSHRLQRVSPTSTLNYSPSSTSSSSSSMNPDSKTSKIASQATKDKSYIFPPGTPLSMSTILMHDNEKIFPNAAKFDPDRWLPLDTMGKHLSKYLVPFSRGSRQCVGMNLAWAEMYFIVAAMFRPGGPGAGGRMKLWDTVFERDVKTTVDGFSAMVAKDSKGMRVVIDPK